MKIVGLAVFVAPISAWILGNMVLGTSMPEVPLSAEAATSCAFALHVVVNFCTFHIATQSIRMRIGAHVPASTSQGPIPNFGEELRLAYNCNTLLWSDTCLCKGAGGAVSIDE